ncbi:IclR family transcriptional regulator [Natrialbaceae archaeon AArc-T1-2]|uniref:IclR family transcriptional regulator n=1 Tax=Natrialbaceae archaeon AArc-T1-2 TaxID=3053904 RepID=UPI00255AA601|nr:IclR family transcriptional regulator [Natrialbaceae archaeon AArc-T1-2]WIV66999.1 IclR family transcriptional regulator [Natrialbaceae archaeon AArc-T1-2]
MNEGTRTINAVETAFDIVEHLKEVDGAGVTELATELDLAKSTVHNHLATLYSKGYVVRDGDTYRVALRFLDLGNYAREEDPLYQVGQEKVDELAAETGEKVWILAEEHGRAVHLYDASGKRSVRTYARTGQLNYLHQLAAGKAILAYLPDERVMEIIDRYGLPARTDDTITDPDELRADLERIRERGFAQNREESIPGLHAVGVPITDEDGVAIGSLSLSAPAKRLRGERFDEKIPNLLLGVANEIEINMAYI